MVVALLATVDAVDVPENFLAKGLQWASNYFVRVRRGQTDNSDEVVEQPGMTANSLAINVASKAATTACSIAASVGHKLLGTLAADAAAAASPTSPIS
jgi:hypothetical protein